MDDLPLFWIVVVGAGAILVIAAIVFFGFRAGWLAELGFEPSGGRQGRGQPAASHDSGGADETVVLLKYIKARLDALYSRVELLEINLNKARGQLHSVESLIQRAGDRPPPSSGAWGGGQPLPPPSPSVEPHPETRAGASAGAGRVETIEAARAAYQTLTDERASATRLETIFADLDSPAQGAVIGEVSYSFRPAESKHSQFVIIPRDGSTGWLFPNPNILFTEAMKVVFPSLSREQFEDHKNRIEPVPVRAGQSGMWERAG